MNELSTEQFNKLTQHIYLRLGLHFEDKKAYFLQKRVEKRMAALEFHDPQDYVFLRLLRRSRRPGDAGPRQPDHHQRNVHVSRVRAAGSIRQ